MVEVPAVIEVIEEFAQIVDFFSIGTNDLVQYMLAVDRTDETVEEYYIPHHPAVLRAIKRVADAGIACGKEVSVCGDMANKKEYLKFIIGCGIRKVSMNTVYLAENQKAIIETDTTQARALALRLLSLGNMAAIEKELFGR
ncbi:MAG: Phosphoenolpyruvate-protein phosphotransferase [Smithella sp. PtaU1.Bin162]|nr:MAG: Phosphoenolpyruvate-protein phosphotransferase [Smithella sp. PtaU1.Bin162]